MTNANIRRKLVELMGGKGKMLTVKLDLDTLVEFAVAAKIFRARSVSSFLHQFVVGQINEAKKLVTTEEFNRLVAIQKAETLDRARLRSKLRKQNSEVTFLMGSDGAGDDQSSRI